jgi:hypothetical protein
MWVVGIDEVSDCWRVKVRVGGEGGRCACFLTCSQLHLIFPVQCIGCVYPSMLPRTLKAQSFHLLRRKTISFVFGETFPRSCSPLGP